MDYHATADSGGRGAIHHRGRPLRFKGNDRMWGRREGDHRPQRFRGARRLYAARPGHRFAVLVGKPRVEGKGARPYALTGTRIELGLQGQEIRLVKALGDGVGTGRLAPHGGHDPPAPSTEEAAAGVRQVKTGSDARCPRHTSRPTPWPSISRTKCSPRRVPSDTPTDVQRRRDADQRDQSTSLVDWIAVLPAHGPLDVE